MKKVVSIFGAVLGLAIAVVGFLVMRGEIFIGVFAETTTADSAVTTVFETSATDKFGPSSSYYDTGYSVFGADFYTYVNNNTAMAAEAAGATAINTKTAAINSGLAVANAAAAAKNAAVAANNANAVSKNIIVAAKLQQSLVGLILLCFGSVSCFAFLMLWPSVKKEKNRRLSLSTRCLQALILPLQKKSNNPFLPIRQRSLPF